MKKILLAFFVVSPMLLMAQGFQLNLQGQKQQSMGGAGTGTSLDAASVFYNPGAISMQSNSVSAGVSLTVANTAYRDAGNQSQASTHSPVGTPFTGYAVWGPNSSRWKFGLGVYTPFGSTVNWQSGWTGRFVLTDIKLFSVFIQPTVSYKINDKLGIGAGFVYGIGVIDLKRDLPVTDAQGNYGTAHLHGNANGIGFNAGIYYKPLEKVSIGLSYRSQVNMKVNNGDATFTVPASLASNFPSGSFNASLPLPQVATIGVGVQATDKLLLVFDASFIGWASYDTLAFDYANNTSSLKDTKSARNYQNTYALRLGAQYKATDKLNIRAGLNYEHTPIQNGYVTPEVPDANRLNVTGGLGYAFSEKLTADASFSFINFMKRTDTNLENGMNGTYKSYIFIPGISLAYTF